MDQLEDACEKEKARRREAVKEVGRLREELLQLKDMEPETSNDLREQVKCRLSKW